MNQIGLLIALYILGTLYVLAPWIYVTFMLQSDKKVKKNNKK